MRPPDPALPAPNLRVQPGRGRLRALTLLIATIIGLYVCYLLSVPFIPAQTSAGIKGTDSR